MITDDSPHKNNKLLKDLGYYLGTILISAVGYEPKYGKEFYDYPD